MSEAPSGAFVAGLAHFTEKIAVVLLFPAIYGPLINWGGGGGGEEKCPLGTLDVHHSTDPALHADVNRALDEC